MESESTASGGNPPPPPRNIERVGDRAHKAFDAVPTRRIVRRTPGEQVDTLAEKRDELMEPAETWIEAARDKCGRIRGSDRVARAAGYCCTVTPDAGRSLRWSGSAARTGELIGRILAETRCLVADFAHLAGSTARRAAINSLDATPRWLVVAVLVVSADGAARGGIMLA